MTDDAIAALISELDLDEETGALLHRYGFDAETFTTLRRRLKSGEAGPEANRIRGEVRPPGDDDVSPLPPRGSDARAALTDRGLEAIRAGHVGMVTLAGGMATRFGGVVKAAVDAVDGHSFLALKLRDVERLAERTDATVPAYLMTSFATHDEVTRLGGEMSTERAPVTAFPQFISLRLTPDGALFRDAAGEPSPYAPGHGDLPFALRRASLLRDFRAAGGRLLYMSNVDNLGATLDPAVIGHHLESGCQVTAEVVAKHPGDKGGAPARVDGDLQIVEAFRFPDGFDQDTIGVFNTNSFVLDAAALEQDFALSWFAVNKKVEGRDAVQFERLVGQVTAFLPTAFVQVERSGTDGRFQPVKDPDELARRRPEIRELLQARGVL
ncbi:MAG TPA: UTP--glucose-1-phosphate uridylyltransferase [Sandaracinaceae bacterium LLY-WYZ-13_1]|nr:UTP--glucose-1-phosphate uridylyltransferase [Sandaracinaceae bacterium LLY-WYZ-13_1]